jgi:dienelactone hydrolase
MKRIRPLIRLATLCIVVLASFPATAAMRVRPVEWTHDGQPYRGFLVHDDAVDTKRPGLVMVPNWMGVNESAIDKAKVVAGRDYVVLVADVYGRKVRPKNAQQAGAAAKVLRDDRVELRIRMAKALEALKGQAKRAPLDPDRIGVFGFCFGGTAALELARAGADIDGVVSLHGGLTTPLPAQAGRIASPLLVLNGAADKAVPREDVIAFRSEMDAAGADWQFVDFSGAVHCFAEADAGNDPASNCRYDARSAARAYEMMRDFFRERFAADAISGRDQWSRLSE